MPGPVLLVHGSTRSGGNTDLLLDAFARGVADAGAHADRLVVRDLSVKPCVGCNRCFGDGRCVQTGDDMAGVYERVDRASAVVVGSPVYFLGLPAPLKAVVDRFQCRWARLHVLDRSPGAERPGAFLATAGAPVHSVFTCPSRCVEALFEVLGVRCRANLFYEGVDERGAVRDHPTALDEARAAGRALAGSLPV